MLSPVGPIGVQLTNRLNVSLRHVQNVLQTLQFDTTVFIAEVKKNKYNIWLTGPNYSLIYCKKEFCSSFFLLFQKINWEASVNVTCWPAFLLLYCCHKKNMFVWLE